MTEKLWNDSCFYPSHWIFPWTSIPSQATSCIFRYQIFIPGRLMRKENPPPSITKNQLSHFHSYLMSSHRGGVQRNLIWSRKFPEIHKKFRYKPNLKYCERYWNTVPQREFLVQSFWEAIKGLHKKSKPEGQRRGAKGPELLQEAAGHQHSHMINVISIPVSFSSLIQANWKPRSC